jgi:hypothetical protein
MGITIKRIYEQRISSDSTQLFVPLDMKTRQHIECRLCMMLDDHADFRKMRRFVEANRKRQQVTDQRYLHCLWTVKIFAHVRESGETYKVGGTWNPQMIFAALTEFGSVRVQWVVREPIRTVAAFERAIKKLNRCREK